MWAAFWESTWHFAGLFCTRWVIHTFMKFHYGTWIFITAMLTEDHPLNSILSPSIQFKPSQPISLWSILCPSSLLMSTKWSLPINFSNQNCVFCYWFHWPTHYLKSIKWGVRKKHSLCETHHVFESPVSPEVMFPMAGHHSLLAAVNWRLGHSSHLDLLPE